jgi:hypothetical protein
VDQIVQRHQRRQDDGKASQHLNPDSLSQRG